jgi:hypothetical protein
MKRWEAVDGVDTVMMRRYHWRGAQGFLAARCFFVGGRFTLDRSYGVSKGYPVRESMAILLLLITLH